MKQEPCAELSFGSVCSGIEAASVAWEPLGWRAAWLAEIESFPAAVLAHHYPAVPNLGDMTTIARRVLTGEVVAPDVFTGGTPCQAFSVAGLRESLSDARGNLTLKFVELADAIDHVRIRAGKPASVIVWENVPGVLSTKDNAFGCFLAGLAGEDDPLQPPGGRWANAGCVYGPRRAVAWRTLDAQHFGLAQRRRRVFVVASARNDLDPAAVLFEWEGMRRDTPPRRGAGQEAPAGTLRSTDGGSDVDHARAGHLQAFGGNRTSGSIDVAAALNACASASASGRLDFDSETFITHAQPLPFDTTQITSKTNRCQPQHGDPCHPVAAHAHAPAIAMPQAVAVTGDIAHTPNTANNGKGCSEDGTGRGVPTIAQAMQVRRLTPEECEALQGFPKGYTRIAWRGKPPEECPDGPRYKAIGNSWATHVARWIGRRIDNALAARERRAA